MGDEFYYVGYKKKDDDKLYWISSIDDKTVKIEIGQDKAKAFRSFDEAKKYRNYLWSKKIPSAFITSDNPYTGVNIYSEYVRNNYTKDTPLIHIFKDEYYGRLTDKLFKVGSTNRYDMIVKPYIKDDEALMVIYDSNEGVYKKLSYNFNTNIKKITEIN